MRAAPKLIVMVVFILLLSNTGHAAAPSLDYFRLFNEHGSIMLLIEVETGEIEFSNLAAQKFYGYSKEKLESMNVKEINVLTYEEIQEEMIVAAKEERNHFIFKHRLANNDIRTVEVFSYPFMIEGQAVLFSIINDITATALLAENKAALRSTYTSILLAFVALLTVLSTKLYQLLLRYRRKQELLLESERVNSTLVANIQGMVYRCKNDEYWTMKYVSDGCFHVTGYRPAELINNATTDFNNIIEEGFRTLLREKWDRVIEQGSIFEHEYFIIAKDGTKRWVLERGQVIYSKNGEIEAIEGIITDVSRLKLSEEQAREYYQKLYATLISVGDGVITTDSEGKIELINPVTHRITDWSQEEACGQDFSTVFKIINEYTREKTKCPVEEVFETGSIVELANHTLLVSREGKETPIEDTASPIKDMNGNIVGTVVIFRDCSERHEKKKQIEYVSYHDYLTGLYNRRFFEEELSRLDCERNYPISIILLDVNGLKIVNDAFGHATGDELIKTVAQVLVRECRQDDIVARYGGDEYTILLPRTNEIDAENLATRIKQLIEREKIMSLAISISVGWDTKNSKDQSITQVINNAENYMYQKKIVENLSKRSLVIKSILNTLLIKNPREEEHSKRVSLYCEGIGAAYNLCSDEIKRLKGAGELHDIGKIAIDDSILNKVGNLTDYEWIELKKHPETGHRILSTSNEFVHMSVAISAHHERWDGKGYPKGLRGEEIPFEARIIAVADAYDAMTSDRPYRKALSKNDAVNEMIKNSGTQFDPEIVKVFLEKVVNTLHPPGSEA